MSTRATYLIAASQEMNDSVCFYVHNDNYPEGAAHYFRQMHGYKNLRGHYAGRFFRANVNAEFTLSHDSHCDTEYRYTLNAKGQLKVLHRELRDKWVTIYKGPWYEFVNQQLPDEETLSLFKTTKCQKEVMTLTEAKRLQAMSKQF